METRTSYRAVGLESSDETKAWRKTGNCSSLSKRSVIICLLTTLLIVSLSFVIYLLLTVKKADNTTTNVTVSAK